MPARRMVGLALLALSAAAPVAARPLARQEAVARCAAQAPATLRGLSALRSECPGIGRAVAGLRLREFLPPHWRQALTPRALAGFAALTRRYGGSPRTPLPDAATLRTVALALKPPPPPPSWWTRVKAWIARWSAPLRRTVAGWLRSLAGTGARSALPLIITLGGLLLLALVVAVVMELRSSGLIGSGSRSMRRRRARNNATAPSYGTTSMGAVDWNTLRERPVRLFRVLVEALVVSHRIGHNTHLTCHEICMLALFDSPRQRQDFELVARLAEHELYGPDRPPPVPETTLRAAQALRTELLSAPARPEAEAP